MDRLPPGQRWVEKVPVLHHGEVPDIVLEKWRFFIKGLLKDGSPSVELEWEDFMKLPKSKVRADFHCVTGWSVEDVEWEGVPFKEIYEYAPPSIEARHVMVHSYGGYSANVPLAMLLGDGALFAFRMNGAPLTPLHGGPLRLVLPRLYAWKSAKWAMGIEYMDKERPGFWESRGYHIHGDPWKEERYS